MRNQFPLFQSHLDQAHNYWQRLLKPGDIAIDATCGNGHDSLIIAKSILNNDLGLLYAIDIQKDALEKTQNLLQSSLSPKQMERIQLIHSSHEEFPSAISPQSVKLIVYNLGYLPGGDKTLTTLGDTTVKSLQSAIELVAKGGAISITCYPGHAEGEMEQEKVFAWLEQLPPTEWSVAVHQWINRNKAPILIFVQKKIETL